MANSSTDKFVECRILFIGA